jgi:N-acetylmuramoyl-L-alanine amidase
VAVANKGRRVLIWVVAVAVAVAAATAGLQSIQSRAVAMPECPDGPVIVIDPGHGGIDGGTNVPGLLEKEITLDVALRTKAYLDRFKVPVVLTRSDDSYLGGEFGPGSLRRDLNFRIRVANHCQAGMMLSLHVNHTRDSNSRGMLVLYQPTRAGRDAAFLFDDILRRWPLHQRRERPIPRRDLAVLKTKAPAILVEMGFISNEADRQLLADPAYREKIAQAMASGCAAIYQQWLKHGSR